MTGMLCLSLLSEERRVGVMAPTAGSVVSSLSCVRNAELGPSRGLLPGSSCVQELQHLKS